MPLGIRRLTSSKGQRRRSHAAGWPDSSGTRTWILAERPRSRWLTAIHSDPADALPHLLTTLGDADCWVRQFSSVALTRIGEPALEGIATILRGENPRAKESAIYCLRSIQPVNEDVLSALRHVAEGFESEDSSVYWAAYHPFRISGGAGGFPPAPTGSRVPRCEGETQGRRGPDLRPGLLSGCHTRVDEGARRLQTS